MSSDSRHFPPFPDYNPDIAKKCLQGTQLKQDLSDKVDDLIDRLQNSVNGSLSDHGQGSDYSIYTGYTGYALTNYLIYKKTNSKKHFFIAKELTEKALQNLKGRRISFLNGDAGPLALGAVLYIAEKNLEKADQLIARLIELGDLEDPSIPDEILYGRAGYLYALLFVDQESRPVIPEMVLRKHVEKILHSGSRLAKRKKSPVPLEFEWHDKVYLGAAHGYAGILYILLIASRYMSEFELESLVKPTLDWLITMRFPSKNFRSSSTSDSDRLVQWCHGAPGFTTLLTLAAKVYDSQTYKKLALECGDVVWERGLLRKGYSICHGVSGNAYTFLHLYKLTKDIIHLYRAASFVDWCSRYPSNEGLKPDRPFSLFEGKAGLLYFLIDMKDPTAAAFPGYELKISQ